MMEALVIRACGATPRVRLELFVDTFTTSEWEM